jgi:hypothetical protein
MSSHTAKLAHHTRLKKNVSTPGCAMGLKSAHGFQKPFAKQKLCKWPINRKPVQYGVASHTLYGHQSFAAPVYSSLCAHMRVPQMFILFFHFRQVRISHTLILALIICEKPNLLEDKYGSIKFLKHYNKQIHIYLPES